MNDRARIDAVLDSAESWSEGDWPPVAERFRKARERSGLTFQQIGELMDAEPSVFWDLEWYDDEVFTVPSVSDVTRLAKLLDVGVHDWLFGFSPEDIPGPRLSLDDVAAGIADVLNGGRVTREELEERLDLDVEVIVDEPSSLGDLRIYEFREVCRAAGVDWVRALPARESDV